MSRLMLLSLAVCVLNLLQCSYSSEPVSGGTGVGNPPQGVAASFIIYTDTVDQDHSRQISLAKSSLMSQQDFRKGPLSIQDQGGEIIQIDSAELYTAGITLHYQTQIDTNGSLDYSGRISEDRKRFFINIPIVFNILQGSSEPRLDSIIVPVGACTGVVLPSVDPLASEQSIFVEDIVLRFRLVGRLMHQNIDKPFVLTIALDSLYGPVVSAGNTIEISNRQATLALQLLASQWVDKINFHGCVLTQQFEYDQYGRLSIDATDLNRGPCKGVAQQIKQNVASSGTLQRIGADK